MIKIAPKEADEFILSFAQKHEFCFIISNDKFRDYIDQLLSKAWLEDRRVPFMLMGDEVCLSPNVSFEIIDVLPLDDEETTTQGEEKRKENLTKNKPERTTLSVLARMEKTEGEFDLF